MGDMFTANALPSVRHLPGEFEGTETLATLLEEIPLQQFKATMYGKTFNAPRLECWYGLNPYSFGGRVVDPTPWGLRLASLKGQVELTIGQKFDSCFANYYRDGNDCIDWHADDESWIGPWIASVTFGAARKFVLKHNETGEKHEYMLGNGDLFVMEPGTQQKYKHCVPRTKKPVGPRLNLTFRQTVSRG